MLALLLAGLLVPVAVPVAAQDPAVVPGRYIVVYRDDIVAAADVTEVIDNERGVEVTHVYQHAMTGFAGELSDEAFADLLADPRVAEVIPDRKMYPFAQRLPSGANRIDADLNPTAAIDGVDQRVDADIAILDMGVGPHPDLNVVGGFDCTGRNTVLDNGGHGTHVAGIAAALDNTSGMVGVAPGARIWSVKVLDAFDGNWSWVICGIDWVTGNADVIEVANMSLGEDLGPNNQVHDGPMRRAIQRSVEAGVTYVVAAGNGGDDAGNVIPARYPEVITVSAIADSDGRPGGLGSATSRGGDDRFATFSSYGSVVDIAAPGVETYSLAPGGGYSIMSGTSFATPHVAGAVALYTAQFGRAGPDAIRAALLATADPGPIPGDPDGFPEAVLNVGRFGNAEVAFTGGSSRPGDTVSVSLSAFSPSTELTLAWDGNAVGTVTTDATGRATVAVRVPALSKGAHLFSARSASDYGSAVFTIRPVVRLSPTSGAVGRTVTVALRGFASRDQVTLVWDNGGTTSMLKTVTVSGSGNVNATFVVPASTGGRHRLIADTRSGGSVRATFTVTPSISRSPAEVGAGGDVRLALRGFAGSEQVDVLLETSSGVEIIGATAVSSRTGSRNVTVTIPPGATEGAATLRASGSFGTTIETTLTITGGAEQADEPNPSSTESVGADASPWAEPVAHPTATPEAMPTVEATSEAAEPGPDGSAIAEPTLAPQPPEAAAHEVRRVSRSAGSEAGRVVVDGDRATVWTSPVRSGREVFIQFDLGATVPIAEVRLVAEREIAGIEIQVSADRRAWTPVVSVSLVPGETWVPLGVSARYVRLVFVGVEPGGVAGGLADVELWPPAGDE